MRTIEQLDAIEDIRQLKARYCLYLDNKAWNAWRELFPRDASLDMTEAFAEPVAGIEAIMARVVPIVGPVKTIHQCHTPLIELTSPTTATGVWAMEDVLLPPRGGRLHGYGHYHETY